MKRLECISAILKENTETMHRENRKSAVKGQATTSLSAYPAMLEGEEEQGPSRVAGVCQKDIDAIANATTEAIKAGTKEAIRMATRREEEDTDSKMMYYNACASMIEKETELREPTAEEKGKWKGGQICLPFITTGCDKGNGCPNHHTKSSRICLSFQKKEGCKEGSSCKFYEGHELIGSKNTFAVATWSSAKAKQRKLQSDKEKSAKKKDEQKKTPCWNFQKGNCRFGEKCNFAHVKE